MDECFILSSHQWVVVGGLYGWMDWLGGEGLLFVLLKWHSTCNDGGNVNTEQQNKPFFYVLL